MNTIDLYEDKEVFRHIISESQNTYIDDYELTLCAHVLRSNSGIKNIDLPEVTAVPSNAFDGCSSLISASFDNASSVKGYAFRDCKTMRSINLPKVTILNGYAFESCSSLGMVSLPCLTTPGSYMCRLFGPSGADFTQKLTVAATIFSSCYKFSTLILRSLELCPLSNVSAFSYTPISVGCGWIYVPDDLVNTYKSASNWSTYASRIVPLSQYPKEFDGGTITDTWAQIFAAEEDGTYKTKYSVGDTKAVSINGACVIMQIVDFDVDDLSDNSGKAKITWISVGIVDVNIMGLTNEGGWPASLGKQVLYDRVYPFIDSNVKDNIKSVKKITKVGRGSDQTTEITDELVWIPSYKEMCGNPNSTSVGVAYSYFTDNTSRIKRYGGTNCGELAKDYWLRSNASNLNYYDRVINSGGFNSGHPNTIYGIVLGFCT